MTKIARTLLIVEMLIAFVPLCLAWTILVSTMVNTLLAIGTAEFHWLSMALTIGLCAAGVIGGIALNAMRIHLFWGGKRPVSRRRMIVFCAVAIGVLAVLAALSLPDMFGGRASFFALLYTAALLCALHLLWLGRSYFADAKAE